MVVLFTPSSGMNRTSTQRELRSGQHQLQGRLVSVLTAPRRN